MPLIPAPPPGLGPKFLPQTDLPFTTRALVSDQSLKKVANLGQAAFAVRRECVKILHTTYLEGLRFPNPLYYVLHDLERDLDRLGVILNAENIPHWADTTTPEPEPPTQDRREETPQRLDGGVP